MGNILFLTQKSQSSSGIVFASPALPPTQTSHEGSSGVFGRARWDCWIPWGSTSIRNVELLVCDFPFCSLSDLGIIILFFLALKQSNLLPSHRKTTIRFTCFHPLIPSNCLLPMSSNLCHPHSAMYEQVPRIDPRSSSPYSRNPGISHVSPLMTVQLLDYFEGIDYVLRYLGFLISINDENSKSFRSRKTSNTDWMRQILKFYSNV